jgi:hypothetical protein
MKDFKKLFFKIGGVSLIKHWLKTGMLFYALRLILVLGFSKKNLEILRLALQQKVYKRIKNKYSYVLSKPFIENSSRSIRTDTVWVCWLQGIESAPKLVQECFKSLQKNLRDKQIVLITTDNIDDFVHLPYFIKDKWEKGIITNTHFSDILRIELLLKYGGTWIDSTVLCTSQQIPDYIFKSDFFLYQVLKPGSDGHTINLSSWLMSSKNNNKILLEVRELLYEYWKRENYLEDYFLLHVFIEMVLDKYPSERNKIPKFSNSIPHVLLLQFFEEYNQEKYEHIKSLTPFHKLNYKREVSDLDNKNTFYDFIINQENY